MTMNRQEPSREHEIIVANAISEVVAELRLVDVGDYLAFLRFEQYGAIADLVDSAAELYFMPGALRLGNGGEAVVGWGEVPKIKLDLELRLSGAVVYFTLTLEDEGAGIDLNYVDFDHPPSDQGDSTPAFVAMIEDARIRKTPMPANLALELRQ